MESFYNNKINGTVKFKLDVTGTDPNLLKPRLVFESDTYSVSLTGEVTNGNCEFSIPELSMFESNTQGNLFIEVVCEEQYFKVWENNYEIESKTEIKISNEGLNRENYENKIESKVQVSLNNTLIRENSEAEEDKKVKVVLEETIDDAVDDTDKEITKETEEFEEFDEKANEETLTFDKFLNKNK